MLSGCCGSTSLLPTSGPALCRQPKEGAKGNFPGVHTGLCTVLGACLWKEGVGREETEPRKELGRRERSEGERVCVEVFVRVCLLASL